MLNIDSSLLKIPPGRTQHDSG